MSREIKRKPMHFLGLEGRASNTRLRTTKLIALNGGSVLAAFAVVDAYKAPGSHFIHHQKSRTNSTYIIITPTTIHDAEPLPRTIQHQAVISLIVC